jgi:hypothetical protein
MLILFRLFRWIACLYVLINRYHLAYRRLDIMNNLYSQISYWLLVGVTERYCQLLRLQVYGTGQWATLNTPAMIITGKHSSTQSKPSKTDTFGTTNPIKTDLGLSKILHNDRPPSNRIRGKTFSLAVTIVSYIPKHIITILGKRNKIQVWSTNHYETSRDVLPQYQHTVTCIFWKVQTTCTNWTVI